MKEKRKQKKQHKEEEGEKKKQEQQKEGKEERKEEEEGREEDLLGEEGAGEIPSSLLSTLVNFEFVFISIFFIWLTALVKGDKEERGEAEGAHQPAAEAGT